MDIHSITQPVGQYISTGDTTIAKKSHAASDSVVLGNEFGSERLFANMAALKNQAATATAETSAVSAEYKSDFHKNYLDAKQVDMKLLELAEKYPDFVSVTTRDFKTSGYDGKETSLQGPSALRYVRIGNDKAGDPDRKMGVLLLASPHARECMNPLIMLETMQRLLENYNPQSDDPKVKEAVDLLNSLNIYMVPVSNPDGLNYAIHDDPSWRKTRCEIPGSTERGVDTNRNFDYLWEPADPAEQTYPGTGPCSEPETKNVVMIVEEHPEIKFACDFHSMGEQIRRPLGVTDRKDLEVFEALQDRMAGAINTNRGKEYERIESEVVNGASDDFFYYKKGIYALVVEDGKNFKPEVSEALQVVKEVSTGAMEFLKFAKEYADKQEVASAAAPAEKPAKKTMGSDWNIA